MLRGCSFHLLRGAYGLSHSITSKSCSYTPDTYIRIKLVLPGREVYALELSLYCSGLFSEKIFPLFASTKLKSKQSHDNYIVVINHICEHFEMDFLELSSDEMKLYFDGLNAGTIAAKNKRRFSPATIYDRYAKARAVSNFILLNQEDFHITYESPFAEPILKENSPYLKMEDVLALQECEKLLSCTKDVQLYLIFSLALRCGLSEHEIITLGPQNLILDGNNQLFIPSRRRKSDEPRHVKVPDELKEQLLNHAWNIPLTCPTVFYNRYGEPFKPCALQRKVKRHMAAAGFPGWTLQDLRNTASAHMLSGGASASSVAHQLNISERWMFRYEHVVNELQASDYSKIGSSLS